MVAEEYKFWILVLKLESLLTEPLWGERKEEAEGQEDNHCQLRGSLEEKKEKRDEQKTGKKSPRTSGS